jgi:uncharacterized protein (TIGR02246 family)
MRSTGLLLAGTTMIAEGVALAVDGRRPRPHRGRLGPGAHPTRASESRAPGSAFRRTARPRSAIIRSVPAREDVAEVLAAIEAAWNDADAAALARHFAADAMYVTRGGSVWRGRPAIEEGHAKALAGPLAGTVLTLRPTHLVFPATSVAIAQVDVEMSGEQSIIRAVTTFVLSLDAKRWSIVAAHTSEAASVH